MQLAPTSRVRRRRPPVRPTSDRTPGPPAELARLQAVLGNRGMRVLVMARLRSDAARSRHEREAERAAGSAEALPPRGTRPRGAPPMALQVRSPAALPARLGPGRPLDAATRAHFESRFGRDLGGVRIRTTPPAAASAEALGADAYTVSDQIVFAPGRYRPRAPEGRRLLAHELAHVVQQGGGTPARAAGPALTPAPTRVARQPRRGGSGPGAAGRLALSGNLSYDRDTDRILFVLDPTASFALPVGESGLFGLRSPTGLRLSLGLGSGEVSLDPLAVRLGFRSGPLRLGTTTLAAPVLRGSLRLPSGLSAQLTGQPRERGFFSGSLLGQFGRAQRLLSSPVSGLRGEASAELRGHSPWQYPIAHAWGQTVLDGFAGGRLRLDAEVNQPAGTFRLSAFGAARIRLEGIGAVVAGTAAGRLPTAGTVRLGLWGSGQIEATRLPRSLPIGGLSLAQLLRATGAEGGGAIYGELRVLGIPGDVSYRFRIDADGVRGRAALDFPRRVPFLLGARGPVRYDFHHGLSGDLTMWGLVQLMSSEVQERLAVEEARGAAPGLSLHGVEQVSVPSVGFGVGHLHFERSGQRYLSLGLGGSDRLYLGAFFRKSF